MNSAPKLKLDMKRSSSNIFDDLGSLLDTPTAEKILDNFLTVPEPSHMIMPETDLESQKWPSSFDDLFPDLD